MIEEMLSFSFKILFYFKALHVEGNITTEFGLNGYKLTEMHQNAVSLSNGNYIRGHLTFKVCLL